MKKIFKLIGIIAIVAIIGFSFTACEEEEDDPPPPPPPYANYLGTWVCDSDLTLVITSNEFKVDSSEGYELYFTINNWVESPDGSSVAEYPKGYKLEGSISEITPGWGDFKTVGQKDPVFVFMHTDGTKIRFSSSTNISTKVTFTKKL